MQWAPSLFALLTLFAVQLYSVSAATLSVRETTCEGMTQCIVSVLLESGEYVSGASTRAINGSFVTSDGGIFLGASLCSSTAVLDSSNGASCQPETFGPYVVNSSSFNAAWACDHPNMALSQPGELTLLKLTLQSGSAHGSVLIGGSFGGISSAGLDAASSKCIVPAIGQQANRIPVATLEDGA